MLRFVMTGSIVLVLSLPAGAQDLPLQGPLGLTNVSYSLPAANGPLSRDLGFQTDGNRDLPFDLGRPDRVGAAAVPLRRAAVRAPVRLAQSRAKKLFVMPWQTGVFQ